MSFCMFFSASLELESLSASSGVLSVYPND